MLTAEDRLEILELYARYNHYFDAGEADGWAGTFTPDGIFAHQSGGISVIREAFDLRGTVELASHVRRFHGERIGNRGIRHEVTNIVIEATESGARGFAYMVALRVGDQQPPQVTSTGRYVDELVKGAHGWRFRSRTFMPDTAPAPPSTGVPGARRFFLE